MFIQSNPNPLGKNVGDCTVRAISIATGLSWDEVHDDLCDLSHDMADMPSSNDVWDTYLVEFQGYKRAVCVNCKTVIDFCDNHPRGTFILATGSHVIAVIDGDYFDLFDSGSELPIYYYFR